MKGKFLTKKFLTVAQYMQGSRSISNIVIIIITVIVFLVLNALKIYVIFFYECTGSFSLIKEKFITITFLTVA